MNITADQLEDNRLRRRDQAALLTGLLGGGALGAIAGSYAPPGRIMYTVLGAVLGAVVSRLIGRNISADDWDPPISHRSWVGTPSPDDDITRTS